MSDILRTCVVWHDVSFREEYLATERESREKERTCIVKNERDHGKGGGGGIRRNGRGIWKMKFAERVHIVRAKYNGRSSVG